MKKTLQIISFGLFGLTVIAWPVMTFAQNVASETGEEAQSGIAQFYSMVKAKIPDIIVALIILALSFFIAKLAKNAAQRALARTGGHEGAMSIVGKTAYAGSIILGLTVALKITGIDISFIVGAATFGLGFAMKDILQNYMAGVMILLQQPFKVGDIVKIGEHVGRIEEIEARTTFMRVFDGQRVVIPNSDMISASLINFSTYNERRIAVTVGVSYDTDLKKAGEIVTVTLVNNPQILKDPPPAVTFSEFGASSINLVARFWIDNTVTNYLKITSEVIQDLKKAFDDANINIPFPITTLSMNPLDSDDLYKFLGAGAKA